MRRSGFGAGLCWVATSFGINGLFQREPLSLVLINAGYHTLQFTLYTTPPLVILAFVFAVLTNRMNRGQWFFRLAFFLPFILPSATISLIWVFIFTPATGLFASVQQALGITPGAGVLASPNTAMIGVAIATVWWTLGFNFVLYLAGLQEIPRELYEAAIIDGATPWAVFRRVIFPLLRPAVITVIVVSSVAVYNDFVNPLYFLPGDANATVQLTLFNFQSQFLTRWNLLFADVLLITIPPMIMFVFFQRQIV